MSKLFDLNIEQVLENWSVSDALREIIANALDEQILSDTKPINIYKDNDIWHIRDYGRGIKYDHFTQKENDEKVKSGKLIGKFGVGLKDALAVLFRHGCTVVIESQYNHVEIKMSQKIGFDIQTLHAEFMDPVNSYMEGTDFAISNISDDDMENARRLFLIFNNLELLESTKYGDVYACQKEQIPSIYINGVKVAEERNFMFNYNITFINSHIRNALNRERSNVGRTAYTGTVKNILMSCKTDGVIKRLVDDLKSIMRGKNKDETGWVDVAKHASEALNKNNNVVFMTPLQRSELTAQQVEILKESKKEIIMVPDTIFGKIKRNVETFDNVYKEYHDSFQYKYVNYEELTQAEQKVFDLRYLIIEHISPKYKTLSNIKISENIRVGVFGGSTEGVYEGNSIIIKRSVLSSMEKFCGVLTHELCHHQHGYQDNTRAFENDLTNMLGYSIYKLIICKNLSNDD